MTPVPARQTSWVADYRPNPHARLRLFCFPYAGGSAAVFRLWQNSLPSDVEILPVELPGRGRRWKEKPYSHLSPLVQALSQNLRPYFDKPFAFFGHSLGAVVCFELARQLRRQDSAEPSQLFVSGHRAPHIPDRDPPAHNLPEPDFVEELRRLNGTRQEVFENAELMELMLPLLRADFAVAETYAYTPEPPLDCPLSVFGGVQDEVNPTDLKAWGEHTRSSCSLHLLPGDHFFLHTAQPLLLRLLARELNRSRPLL